MTNSCNIIYLFANKFFFSYIFHCFNLINYFTICVKDKCVFLFCKSISEHFGKQLSEADFKGNYKTFCVKGFVPHMKAEKAMKIHGLDRESMINTIEEALK